MDNLTTILQKMSKDVDTGNERPDRVGDHERQNSLRVCIGKQTEGTQKIECIVPESARGHESPFVAGKCKERKKRRANAEDFDGLHLPIVTCADAKSCTWDLLFMSEML